MKKPPDKHYEKVMLSEKEKMLTAFNEMESEPEICAAWGCGRKLTAREKLFGNKCLNHSITINPHPRVAKWGEKNKENMKIIEGNKLIAEFLTDGQTVRTAGGARAYVINGIPTRKENLDFHISWNSLMPVVERISRIEFHREMQDNGFAMEEVIHTHYPRTFGMSDKEGKPMFRFNCGGLYTADTLIEATWLAVVDFIEWNANQQKIKEWKSNGGQPIL